MPPSANRFRLRRQHATPSNAAPAIAALAAGSGMAEPAIDNTPVDAN